MEQPNVQQTEKNKALESMISQVEKQFGKGSIMRLGGIVKDNIPTIPTGAISLDIALGVGGFPRGRIVEIYGPESSGKTTLALSVVANAQKMGGMAGYIDAEHALDAAYAKLLSVDIDNVIISQPNSGEEGLEILDMMVKSGALDIIVVDSVAALTPKAEIEGDMGDATMGAQARLMSQALRKLTANISKTDTCVVFINQIRQKIGVMFGSPETTTGGQALKFYSSIRLEIRKVDVIKKGEDPIGNNVRVKVVKNKCAPPFKKAEFDMFYDEGISNESSLVDIATKLEVIQKSGTWYAFKDEKLGQGKDNVRLFFKEHKDIAREVEGLVLEKAGIAQRKQMPAEKDSTEVKDDSKPAKKGKKAPSGPAEELPLNDSKASK